MTHRGTSNANDRGSSTARRSRKLWLLTEFGDGELTVCFRCNVPMLYDDLTVDRIIPGARGGRYVRGNIRPACGPCNSEMGGQLTQELKRERGSPDVEKPPGRRSRGASLVSVDGVPVAVAPEDQ